MARRVWLCLRFPPDEGWIVGAVTTLATSVVVSRGGVLVAEIWSTVAEEFRVGNGHLSYRVDRSPWTQHRLGPFVSGVVLFCRIPGLAIGRDTPR